MRVFLVQRFSEAVDPVHRSARLNRLRTALGSLDRVMYAYGHNPKLGGFTVRKRNPDTGNQEGYIATTRSEDGAKRLIDKLYDKASTKKSKLTKLVARFQGKHKKS